MLVTTGRKEKLSASKGSEIEITPNEFEYGSGSVWYCAILEENLAKSKRKKLSVRHLDPLLKQHYLPPLLNTTIHRLIRPVPPPDPFPDVDFEEGEVIDAAYKGGWWVGSVIKVLGSRRYLVLLRFETDVIEVERKDLRPHFVWKEDEWFRCQKEQLIESVFSPETPVEFRTVVENLGDVWAPGIAIKENEDGTLLVKYKSLSVEGDEWAKVSLPYSKIRPSPPPSGLKAYSLMENVEALLESGWCQGVVTKVLSGKKYTVVLGPNKESKEFNRSQLRPFRVWKDEAWHKEEKVSDSEESLHAPASTRIRVPVRTGLRDKKALPTGIQLKATRSSGGDMQNRPPAFSNGGDVAESVIVSDPPLSETAALAGELGSKMANVVMKNAPVTSQPEIPATKVSHSSVVLGVAATPLKKLAVKTQGKTSPRKKLQAMNHQKGSTHDPVDHIHSTQEAPEETRNRESVNKRKRGQPRKFVSTEPKQKTDVVGNGSKATTIELADMNDDDMPLASWIHRGNSPSRPSVPRTPDPTVVEKHVDVVEPHPGRDSTMVLPFVKKSPLWNALESMEVFKTVPQRPHFSPLLESEEEFREGEAIGTMVKFSGLLENVNNLQVNDPISVINRIDECFLKLEKYGFDVTAPRSRIGKLLSIKERQTLALEELKAVEREITENDNKRRKCEEDIVELQRQELAMKETKVRIDKEIARMHSYAAVLDQKVQNVDQEFLATLAAPWK
ncbi:DUF724 domain-containing protein 7 [Cardamine amara subsp. amara]|uniref:DUF724 domain-containing protein 7 n=1 Tax=Cardamine amara subsp. amara TaxID=228776 RepID=A0ABD1BD12_CARAN